MVAEEVDVGVADAVFSELELLLAVAAGVAELVEEAVDDSDTVAPPEAVLVGLGVAVARPDPVGVAVDDAVPLPDPDANEDTVAVWVADCVAVMVVVAVAVGVDEPV